MKNKKIHFIFSILFAFSCNHAWQETDKAEFVSGCVNDEIIKDLGEARAKSYCACMLEKIIKKYPNKFDARFIRQDSTLFSIGKECLKQQ